MCDSQDVDVTAETLAAFLDDAWDACQASANLLRDQLRAFEKNATGIYNQGTLAAVSKNSASQTYRGAGVGSLTTLQIANAWRLLINLFDTTLAAINWRLANPSSNPACNPPDNSDGTVYACMKPILLPVTEYQVDVTDLRLWPTATTQGTAPFAW